MTALPFDIIVGRLRWRLAALCFQSAWARYEAQRKTLHHSQFQPRVPVGNPDGGQWTDGGAGGDRIRVAVRDPRLIARIFERVLRPRVGQSHVDIGRLRSATEVLSRVKELDAGWWPAVEGEVTSPESIISQSERRLAEFGQLAPEQLIERYRAENRMPDLFGHPSWPDDRGTVAVTKIDGLPVFGVNSGAPTYRSADDAEAEKWRDQFVAKFPDVLQTENVGWKPNDAFYHAEATVLLRAARLNGGSLTGQSMEIHVDRAMCSSCETVLPILGRELGNPTVTYIDNRAGETLTMRDGKWLVGAW